MTNRNFHSANFGCTPEITWKPLEGKAERESSMSHHAGNNASDTLAQNARPGGPFSKSSSGSVCSMPSPLKTGGSPSELSACAIGVLITA